MDEGNRSRIVETVIDGFISKGEVPTIFGPAMCGLEDVVSKYSEVTPSICEGLSPETDVVMRTLSLYESGESDGSIRISELFSGARPEGQTSPVDEKSVVKSMVRGGWPSAIQSGRNGAKDARRFLDELGDVTLITPIASQIDTTTSFSQVIRDMVRPISRLTADNRLRKLKAAMVVDNIPTWELGVRPGDRLIMADKWFLTDPSLVAALLDLTPSVLRNRREDLSRVFANLCMRDLRIYLAPLGGDIFHYYTRTRFDGGFIMELADGRWASFKPCAHPDLMEEVAHDLSIIAQAESDRGHPEFSMIVTMGGTAHVRDDGILVVPITCLRD